LLNEVIYHVLSADARLTLVSGGNVLPDTIPSSLIAKEPKLIYFKTMGNNYYLNFNDHPDPYQYSYFLKSLYITFTNEMYRQIFSPGAVSDKLREINEHIDSCKLIFEDKSQKKFSNPYNKIHIIPSDDGGYPVIDDELITMFHRYFNKPRLKFISDVQSFLDKLKKLISDLYHLVYIPDISNIESALPHLPLLSYHYFKPEIFVRLDKSPAAITFNDYNDPDSYLTFLKSELASFKSDIHKVVRSKATAVQLYWFFNSMKFRLNSIRYSTWYDIDPNNEIISENTEPFFRNDFSLVNIYPLPDNEQSYRYSLKLVSPFIKSQISTFQMIMKFINANIDVYESGFIGIETTPKVKKIAAPKNKSKSLDAKSSFSIPNSFRYKYHKSNLSALTDLMYSLVKSGYIDPETDLKDFRRIFNNSVPKSKIIWKRKISELKFFIDYLHRKQQSIDDLKVYIWQVTVKCFVDKNGNSFDSNRFKGLKKPAHTAEIITAASFLI
jgi:hypothetical protein